MPTALQFLKIYQYKKNSGILAGIFNKSINLLKNRYVYNI